jgi:hypothetical protein
MATAFGALLRHHADHASQYELIAAPEGGARLEPLKRQSLTAAAMATLINWPRRIRLTSAVAGLTQLTKAISLCHAVLLHHPLLKGKYKTMPYLLVRHKVSDFSKWKPVYDAHLPVRQAAGLKEKHLLRNVDNPNETFILFEAEDIQKAKEFASSADLRETMQKAGVVDKPDIHFLS